MYKPNCKQKMHQVISPLNISLPLACIEMTSSDNNNNNNANIIQDNLSVLIKRTVIKRVL